MRRIILKVIKLILSILIIIILFNRSNTLALEINTSLKNALNNADKLRLIIEMEYDPNVGKIDYLNSDIKIDETIEIRDFVIDYNFFIDNRSEPISRRNYNIITHKPIQHEIIKISNNLVREKIIYSFQVFEIVDLYLKPLSIYYIYGNVPHKILTPPIPILNKKPKLIRNEIGDVTLKNIKAPFSDIEIDYTNIILWSIVGIITISILIIIFVMVRGYIIRKGKSNIKTPYEIARDGLKLLETSDILLEGRIKDYYIILSEILRKYLANSLKLSIMENTTEEIKNILMENILDKELLEKIIIILKRSDLVKFAHYKPENTQAITDINDCYIIIDKIKLSY